MRAATAPTHSPAAWRLGRHEALLGGLVVAVLALAVRLAFNPLIPPLLNPDSEGYVQAGWDLFRGHGLDLGLRRTPGYGMFIAGTFAALGERLTSITVAQHALGVLNALLALMLGRTLLGAVGGLTVGLLTAISGPLLLYEHYVMTETLSTTTLLVAVVMMLKALSTSSPRWALGAGLCTGIALLCRPALQIVTLMGVVGLVIRCWRAPRQLLLTAGAFIVGTGIFMLPWMVKNAVMYDAFTLAGPGRHLTFRLIRSDTGFSYARPEGAITTEEEPVVGARRVLMEQAAKHDGSSTFKRFRDELGLSEGETNRLQTALALEAIRQQPLYFVEGTLDLFWQIFTGEPINLRREGSDLSEVDWDRSIRHLVNPPPPRGDRAFAQSLLSIWDPARWGALVPAIFLLGLVCAVGRRSLPHLLVAVVALAPQILGAAMAGYALRFRYPFDPLIAIVAWYGLASVAAALAAVAGRRLWRTQRQPA